MKKFLSMALTLAMVFSLFTFVAGGSAGAADYNDVAADSPYKEAINVITSIGIMSGYSATEFGPDGYLSRGAAAKIIAGLRLTPTTADTLPRNLQPFPDVAANSEFAGYITYVRDEGIVGGYSDGTFQPTARLSGYAFLKMLLGALGYSSEVEGFSGGSWTVNVAKVANDADLLDGVQDQISSSGMTRGVATQLILNTLKADLVEYENTTNVIVQDITVVTGNQKPKERTTSNTNSYGTNINSDRDSDGKQILQFAELYFQRLKLAEDSFSDANGQDDFHRPARTWTWRNEEIGKYPIAPDLVRYGNVKLSDIYKDLNLSNTLTLQSSGLVSSDRRSFAVSINGEYVDLLTSNSGHSMNRTNTDEIKDRLAGHEAESYTSGGRTIKFDTPDSPAQKFSHQMGNGTVNYVYYDDEDENVLVCTVIYYAGKVNNVRSATSSADRSIDLEIPTSQSYLQVNLADPTTALTNSDGSAITLYNSSTQAKASNTRIYAAVPYNQTSNITKYETDDFRKDDIVYYTWADGDIVDIGALEKVSGTVSRYTADSSIRLRANGANADYSYADTVAFMGDMKGTIKGDESYDTDSEADIYVVRLNGTPYIMWVDAEGSSSVSDYVLIRNTDVDNLSGDMRARILFSDGTQETVDVYDNQIFPSGISKYPGATGSGRNSGGFVIAKYSERSDGTFRLTSLSTTNGDDGFVVDNNVTVRNNTVSGLSYAPDADTVFVVRVSGSFRTYTGYRNLPTMNGKTAYTYFDTDDRIAKLVFVTDEEGVSVTSKSVTFIAANTASNRMNDGDSSYRTFDAVIDNRVTQVDVKVERTPYTLGTGSEAAKYNDGTQTYEHNGDGNVVCLTPVGLVMDWNNKNDSEANCVILNTTTTDDDLIDSGYFNSTSLRVERARGYDYSSGDYIKVNTYPIATPNGETGRNTANYSWYVSPDANIYLVDDGIESIDLEDLGTDDNDWIYYVVDVDDNELTSVFVVAVDD